MCSKWMPSRCRVTAAPPMPLRTVNIVNPPGTLASIRRDDNPKYRFGKIAGVCLAFESSHSPKLDCGFMRSQCSGCTRQILSRPIHMRLDFWHCRLVTSKGVKHVFCRKIVYIVFVSLKSREELSVHEFRLDSVQ
ncbi:hypothetical protein V6N12_061786 [Hibiscus sabdariffa]